MKIIAKVNMNDYRAAAHMDICKVPQATNMKVSEKARVAEEMQ